MRQLLIDSAAQPITNRLSNPSVTVSASGWVTNNAALYPVARVSTGGVDGGPCAQVTRASTQNVTAVSMFVTGNTNSVTSFKVTPGEVLMGSFAGYTDAANRTITTFINVRDAAGTVIATNMASNTFPMVQGFWTRYSTTSAAMPAGADSAIIGIRVESSDGALIPTGELTKFDQGFFGPPHTEYADGNTPGWRWTGTVDASPSVGYAWVQNPNIVRKEITNLVRNPRGLAVDGTSAPVGWTGSRSSAPTSPALTSGTDLDGTKFWRLTAQLAESHSILISTDGVVYPPTTVVTGLVRMRVNRTMPVRPRISLIQAAPVTVQANTWTWLPCTITLGAARTIDLQPLLNNGDTQVGDTLDISHAMAVVGSYPDLTYLDPSVPDSGWRWNGTPNASTSIGFPFRVESIASPPLSAWTLSGGAYYDPALDEIVLPSDTAWAEMPMIPTLGMGKITWSFEFFASTIGNDPVAIAEGVSRFLINSYYYGPDKVTRAFNTMPSPGPYNGNGNAAKYPPNVWTRVGSSWGLGPAIAYMTHRVQASSAYQSSYRFRKPIITLLK